MSFINALPSPQSPTSAAINICCDANDTVAVTVSGGTMSSFDQPLVGDGTGGGINGGFSLVVITDLDPNKIYTAEITVNGIVELEAQKFRGNFVGKPKRYQTTMTLGCRRPNFDDPLLIHALDLIESGALIPGVTELDLVIDLGDLTYKGFTGGPETSWGQTTQGTDTGCTYAQGLLDTDASLWAHARIGLAKRGYAELCSRVSAVVLQRDDHETGNNYPIPGEGVPGSGLGFSDKFNFDPSDGTPPNINPTELLAFFDNKKIANRFMLAGNPGTVGAATGGNEEDFYIEDGQLNFLISDTTGRFKEQPGVGNDIVSSAQLTRLRDELGDPSPKIHIHITPKTYYPTNGDGWGDYSASVGTAPTGSNGQMLTFLDDIPDGTVQRFLSVTSDRHWGFATEGTTSAGVDFTQINPSAASQELNANAPPSAAITEGEWRDFGVNVMIYDTQTEKLHVFVIGWGGQIFYNRTLSPGSNLLVEENPLSTTIVGYPFTDQTLRVNAQNLALEDVTGASTSGAVGQVPISVFRTTATGVTTLGTAFCKARAPSGTRNIQMCLYNWDGSKPTTLVATSLATTLPVETGSGVYPEVAMFFQGEELDPDTEYYPMLFPTDGFAEGGVQNASTDTNGSWISAGASPTPPADISSSATQTINQAIFMWLEILNDGSAAPVIRPAIVTVASGILRINGISVVLPNALYRSPTGGPTEVPNDGPIGNVTTSGSDLLVNDVTISSPAVLYISPDGVLTDVPNGDPVANFLTN